MKIKAKLLFLATNLSLFIATPNYANICTPGSNPCTISNEGTIFTNIQPNQKYNLTLVLHNRALLVTISYYSSSSDTKILDAIDLDAYNGEAKRTISIGPFDAPGNLALTPSPGAGNYKDGGLGGWYREEFGNEDAYLTEAE